MDDVGCSNYDGKIAGLYDLEKTLGSGHFAVVKSAKHVFTGERVAVKVIDKTKLDDVSKGYLFQEVRCMKMVQHPNVVKLYEVIDTQTKLYLVLELADGGDLYDYIMKHETGLSENSARFYFRQMVRAISYCHKLHVVHRDLKPENIVFFEQDRVVKITDFGFSNKFNPGQKLRTSCGSLAYSAPEILLGDFYDAPSVDVWSLGVILYMLVCGKPPFNEANDSETLTMIMDCKYVLPHHLSLECQELIKTVLIRDPENRCSLEELSNSTWMQLEKPIEEDLVPLVWRQNVKLEDQAEIIHQMVLGQIATKEAILKSLEKNEYNNITATYYLLAEQKMRLDKQKEMKKLLGMNPLSSSKMRKNRKDMEKFLKPPSTEALEINGSNIKVSRTRKCSIVQEEESNDLSTERFNEKVSQRRGSRSEGRLCSIVKPADIYQESKELCFKKKVKINTKIHTSNSSDSSDEENKIEKQKGHCLNHIKYRRDSQDDSSDSQECEKSTEKNEDLKKKMAFKNDNSFTNRREKSQGEKFENQTTKNGNLFDKIKIMNKMVQCSDVDVDVGVYLHSSKNLTKKYMQISIKGKN